VTNSRRLACLLLSAVSVACAQRDLHAIGFRSRPGALTVASSGPASPERVNLVATGLGVVLSPGSLGFGSQTVGTTSAPGPS
jgi:hypothetical protein